MERRVDKKSSCDVTAPVTLVQDLVTVQVAIFVTVTVDGSDS